MWGWSQRSMRPVHGSACAPILAVLFCIPCCAQPLYLSDNFYRTPIVLDRDGVDPVLKYVSVGQGSSWGPFKTPEGQQHHPACSTGSFAHSTYYCPVLERSQPAPLSINVSLCFRSLSISFTRAQGIPKFMMGFGRGKGWESGVAGLDWAAFSIQRGREQGLPDYNSLREAYGLRQKPYVACFLYGAEPVLVCMRARKLLGESDGGGGSSTYGVCDDLWSWDWVGIGFASSTGWFCFGSRC